MIRRTLINRARRQRDLARTLIARHPLAAQDQRQPRLADRPAASSDDSSWRVQTIVEADPAVYYDIAPPEADMTLAEWPAELPAFFNVDNIVEQPSADASAAISIANSVDMPERLPAPLAAALPPAAATEPRPSAPLADLVHRMRDPGWAPPEAVPPATTQTPPAPASSGSLVDLIRRMKEPGWVSPEATPPETTSSDPQVDRVRNMREPRAVSPEQSSSATTQSSASPEQTANERIADIVREMWPAPQRSAPQRERRRTPLGQRMAEAGDFGQTPASPQHVAPKEEQSATAEVEIARLPAIEIAPEEPAADRSPTGESLASVTLHRLSAIEIAPEEPPAAERPRDAVTQTSASIVSLAPLEPATTPPSRAGAAGDAPDVSAPALTPPLPLPPSPSAPGAGEISLPNPSLPPEAPRTPSQQAELDAALSRASAISPAPAPAPFITLEPITAPLRQNIDSPPDVPLHSASTRADFLTPPLPLPPSPSALGEETIAPRGPAVAGEGLEGRASEPVLSQQLPTPNSQLPTPTLGAGEPTLTQRTPTSSFQLPNPTLGASEQALTQSAKAALAAAAQMTAPLVPDRPAATGATEPSAQANLEIRVPPATATDVPRALTDRAPVRVVAAPPAEHAQTNAEPARQSAPAPQRSPSEANTFAAPAQAADVPVPTIAKTQFSPSETAQESRLPSFQQPESSAPQVQSLLAPERTTQAAAYLSLPISSASVEPAAVRTPESGAPQVQSSLPPERTTQAAAHLSLPISSTSVEPAAAIQSMHDARLPQIERADAQQSASNAPERGSPQDWAARLSPAEPPVSARVADTASSTRQPIAASGRAATADDRTGQAAHAESHAAHQSVPAAEARVIYNAPVQPEHTPALHQPPRSTQPADTAAGSAVSPSDQPEPSQAVEAPLAHPNDMQQRSNALPVANDAHQLATARAPEATAAIPIQAPHSALPSPDSRSPLTRDIPAAAADVPAAAAPEPNSPAAWAARFARHRDLTEPQAQPIAAQASAVPVAQPMVQTATYADSEAGVPLEPGSPQAWAARFARHRDLTEPQAQPIAAQASAALIADQAPSAPIEPQAIPAAPGRLVAAVVDPTPGTPVRFVPARRADSKVAPAVSADTRTAATERAPSTHNVTTAATDVPAEALPEPGSPQAWAARFARHRDLTESQAEPTAVRAPAMPIEPPPVQATTPANADAVAAPELGSPQAWAARFARHRDLTEPQAEPTAVRAPAMPIGQTAEQATTPANADAVAASEPGSPQAWAARFARHRDLTEPQAEPTAVRAPATQHQPAHAPLPLAHQPATPAQRNRALESAPQAALRHAQPTPTAETTRRFLKPLVGIDPAEVRIFRGPQAERVTAAYKAEALASGDMVALAAQHGEDSPATLGVLAHELTHIARQRDAQFVPPLVRRENMARAANEESLAQSVEAQVQQIARKRAEPATATSRSQSVARRTPVEPADATPAASSTHANPAAQPVDHSVDWGSLPAPWEPLPEWIAEARQAEAAAPIRSHSSAPTQPVAAPSAALPQRTSGAAAARDTQPVQLAETGRMLDAQPAQSTPTPTPAQQPAPDLDALARQVYAVLKQRLSAERRRSQS